MKVIDSDAIGTWGRRSRASISRQMAAHLWRTCRQNPDAHRVHGFLVDTWHPFITSGFRFEQLASPWAWGSKGWLPGSHLVSLSCFAIRPRRVSWFFLAILAGDWLPRFRSLGCSHVVVRQIGFCNVELEPRVWGYKD